MVGEIEQTRHTERQGGAWPQPLLLLFSLAFSLLVAFAASRLLGNGKVAGAFVLLTYSALVYVAGAEAIRAFVLERRAAFLGMGGFKGLACLALTSILLGLLLEFLTLCGASLSTPFVLSDWGVKRTVVFSLLSFMVLTLLFGLSRRHNVDSINWSHPARSIVPTSGLLLLASIAIVVVLVFSCLAPMFNLSAMPIALFGLAAFISLTVVLGSRRISKIPEWVFICVALPVGLTLCVLVPPMTGASWDDQIHYKNALNLSYVTSPEVTYEEQRMSEMAIRLALGEDEGINRELWPANDRKSHEVKIDGAQLADIEDGRVIKQYYPDQLLSFTSLGYIPSAIGLWIGRLLHLPFSATFILGRVANLLAYCLVCFWAIRITPVKKVLFVTVSLIPESIFLAANYSYDPWLTSMILLGIAILFREMWGSDGPLDYSSIAVSALIMFFGLGVKAVYFPIIGIFFLMPVSKFSNRGQRIRYYLFVVAFGLFVLASFALPFLFNVGTGSAAGDQRGGSGVDSSGQIAYILSNPAQYARILASFFTTTYFNPAYSSDYLFSFAYLVPSSPVELSIASFGNPAVNFVPVLFLIGVALFDNEDGGAWRHAGKGSTIWTAVIYLGTYVLVATALYISFTPVGHDTVNGCQLRYQLPILAPMLALLLNYGKPLGFKDGTKKAIYLTSLLCLLFWTFVFVVSKCVV